MRLSGYGVELAIKNMEYKVLDDSKVQYDMVCAASFSVVVDWFELYYRLCARVGDVESI